MMMRRIALALLGAWLFLFSAGVSFEVAPVLPPIVKGNEWTVVRSAK